MKDTDCKTAFVCVNCHLLRSLYLYLILRCHCSIFVIQTNIEYDFYVVIRAQMPLNEVNSFPNNSVRYQEWILFKKECRILAPPSGDRGNDSLFVSLAFLHLSAWYISIKGSLPYRHCRSYIIYAKGHHQPKHATSKATWDAHYLCFKTSLVSR